MPNPEDYVSIGQPWNHGTLAWETGTAPAALFYGLKASLELLHEYGPARIASYLEELTDHLCERVRSKSYELVSPRTPGEKSQIVCIRHPRYLSVTALYGQLKGQNIITAPRGDRLRIAPHLYNTIEEIDQLVEALP